MLSFLMIFSLAQAQPADTRLHFQQGQLIKINLVMKLNAGQQGFDLNVDGNTTHTYKVTNATDDNTTLHHEVEKIGFNVDGLGQKINFDSGKEKDLNGNFGKPIKEILGRRFDAIIDNSGKVLMVTPEKFVASEADPRMAFISNLLKDLLDVVQPPAKNGSSFFKIFPDNPINKGDSWADTTVTSTLQSISHYTLTDITDSAYVITVVENSVTTSKAEIMGSESTTTLNNTSTGTLLINRQTGILKEKKLTTESTGTTNIMGGSFPVNSKTTIIIQVD
ncbi:MAG TPA: DUF6263 family protein [Chitinophagaceae bacterium]|nr:DUF6263 family protein [Chitinophagaceae bacterium]